MKIEQIINILDELKSPFLKQKESNKKQTKDKVQNK